MLPDFPSTIQESGLLDYDECHIDLGPLARFAGARLYHAEVEGLDPDKKLIYAPGRPPIAYDLVSINTGSRPNSSNVPGVEEFALAAKPIDVFLRKWQQLVSQVRASDGQFRIAVVGGGAGGVELTLSTQLKLHNTLREADKDPENLQYTLLTASNEIMHTHNAGVRKRFQRILAERNVVVKTGVRVQEVTATKVIAADGTSIDSDAVLWVTTASAPSWPAQSGLAVDDGANAGPVDRAGLDGIAANAVLAEFHGERFREADDTPLGRSIRRTQREAEFPGGR